MYQEEMDDGTRVRMMSGARVPTEYGEFRLLLYNSDSDAKEHLALVFGEVAGRDGVLTRVHSECFTGDVLGSLRCDCGPQLHAAMRMISQAGRGVLVYLRQEGRGIGLLDKLRAYGLQDLGYDTVDANLKLGRGADEREYGTAAVILRDLGVRSVDLVTNNPRKIEGLEGTGIRVCRRIPLQVAANAENIDYLNTKARRMDHLLEIIVPPGRNGNGKTDDLEKWLSDRTVPVGRPLVTLSFAQSLDGSIAMEPGKPLILSGRESQILTHRLRRWHDGILVGIGTVLSDDPQLTVRLVTGTCPQPIVVDSTLRFPLESRMLTNPLKPWIVTGPRHDATRRQALEAVGVTVIEVDETADGIDLSGLLQALHARGVQRLMVEGGARILNAFLRNRLADAMVVTIAPTWVGGLPGIARGAGPFPKFAHTVWKCVGDDMVVCAALDWQNAQEAP